MTIRMCPVLMHKRCLCFGSELIQGTFYHLTNPPFLFSSSVATIYPLHRTEGRVLSNGVGRTFLPPPSGRDTSPAGGLSPDAPTPVACRPSTRNTTGGNESVRITGSSCGWLSRTERKHSCVSNRKMPLYVAGQALEQGGTGSGPLASESVHI